MGAGPGASTGTVRLTPRGARPPRLASRPTSPPIPAPARPHTGEESPPPRCAGRGAQRRPAGGVAAYEALPRSTVESKVLDVQLRSVREPPGRTPRLVDHETGFGVVDEDCAPELDRPDVHPRLIGAPLLLLQLHVRPLRVGLHHQALPCQGAREIAVHAILAAPLSPIHAAAAVNHLLLAAAMCFARRSAPAPRRASSPGPTAARRRTRTDRRPSARR